MGYKGKGERMGLTETAIMGRIQHEIQSAALSHATRGIAAA